MKRRQFLSAAGAGTAASLLPAGPAHAASIASVGGLSGTSLLPARMADLVPQNYLVNTKMFYATQVYQHTDAITDLLAELGGRGIRERITTGTSLGTRAQLYAMPRLANRGVKWHATVGNLEDWQNATAVNREAVDFLATRYAPMMGGDLTKLMHSFGGCNEIDGPGRDGLRDPEWASHARTMQRALWEQAKGNPVTRGVRVAGPSTRTDFTRERAAQLGDLSAWCELGNGHLYNKGRSPTAEIDEHLDILSPCFPGIRDYIMTETGYNNSPQDNLGRTIPEWASAIYAIRGICDYLRRDTVYGRFELLDDPDPIDYTSQQTINRTAVRDAHFGLIAMTKQTVNESTPDTWRKKAEFYATSRLLNLLADVGPIFSPEPLELTVSGPTADVQHLLVQKRDGRHYLVLWRDVDVCEWYPSGREIVIAPIELTVEMRQARPIAVYAPNRKAEPLRTAPASNIFKIKLRGDLQVVEIG